MKSYISLFVLFGLSFHLSAQNTIATLNYDSLWEVSKANQYQFAAYLYTKAPDSIRKAIQHNFLERWKDERQGELRIMLDTTSLEQEELRLNRANFKEIPAKVWEMRQLKELNISDNKLTKLPKGILNLKQLEVLDISGNLLTEVPQLLDGLPKLKILRISGNPLTVWKFPALPALEVLEASGLSFVPKNLHKSPKLRTVKLEQCEATKGFRLLRKMPELEHLVLKGSPSTINEKSFKRSFFGKLFHAKHFEQLKTLDLQKCELTTLPKSLAELPSLTTLLVPENKLASLPTSLGDMQNLEVLMFYKNELTEIPSFIFGLKNLTHLDLYYNQLKELPVEVAQLQKLEILYVAHNKISILPESLGSMSNLKEIYLHHNLFYSLPESMAKLKNVRYLHLHNNQFANIPSWVANYQKMEELTLNHNPLSDLPDWLNQLSSLEYLTIHDLLIEKEELEEVMPQIEELRNKGVKVVVEAKGDE